MTHQLWDNTLILVSTRNSLIFDSNSQIFTSKNGHERLKTPRKNDQKRYQTQFYIKKKEHTFLLKKSL